MAVPAHEMTEIMNLVKRFDCQSLEVIEGGNVEEAVYTGGR